MAATDYTHSAESILPVNLEAERSILGAILLDNFCYTQAAALLKPGDFSLDAHRRIYARIVALAESGRPIDYVTLTEELSRSKELEAIGGVAYLTSLTDGLPRVSNIEHYIKIVRDKALLRGVIHTANQAIQAAIAQTESAEDVLTSFESALFHLGENRGGADFQNVKEIVKESFGSIDALYKRGKRVTGLETYYTALDEITSGLQKSDLIIIAARPSMGKTAFALNIAQNAAVKGGKVVGVFSLEMSRESLLLRLLCSEANVDAHKLRSGFLGRQDYEKLREGLGRLAEARIFIDDTPSISVSEVRAKARRLAHQQGQLDLLVVDYLQLMSASPVIGGRKYENRTQEVSAISRGLKMVAKDLNVPLIALSQLSRAPESRTGDGGHRPQLSDLRESGGIEQDADVVAFIYRPEVYDKENPELEGLAEIIIAKQRNGPTGKIELRFEKSATRFDNIESFGDPPPGSPADFDV
jgi:replicative DNA helicase